MRVRDVIEWVILGAVWGGSFLFTKVAVPAFGPFALVEVRLAVAAAVLAVPVFVRREWPHVRARWGTLLVLGVLNCSIPFTLFAWAMQPHHTADGTVQSLSAGDSSVLNATTPLFAVVLGFAFLRERVTLRQAVGLGVGFAGVVTLVWEKLSFSGDGWAVLACLAAAFLYGVSSHVINRRLKGVPSVAVSAASLFFAAVLLLPVAAFNPPAAMPGGRAWAAAVALGVVCTAVGFLMYFRLLANIGPTRAITVVYAIPAFGILWGWLFLSEGVSVFTVVGGAVIVAGVVLVKWPDMVARRASEGQAADGPRAVGHPDLTPRPPLHHGEGVFKTDA
jgi:drug/metabolite transporter (DMT)-like permease